MLLDDIISAAADAILQCLQAMEPFMQRWADSRVQKGDGLGKDAERNAEWDGLEAVEQGLVAFSTLLESHTDIAFDFFEAWSLRNIFALPPDVSVVAPHQKNLDLNTRPEEETDLMTEIEELRRKLENQRRLKRMYQKALRISRLGRARSERRLERLSYLSAPATSSDSASALAALASLPPSVLELFEGAAALPHLDGAVAGTLPLADPSKRLWETGRTGYINWAVGQLIAKSKQSAPVGGGSTAVGNAVEQAARVAETRDVKNLAQIVLAEEEQERADEDSMEIS
ncbi:Mis12 protein-domain-containing protein [Phellopilus nigrolimitatus]|nr:Mis12 protein-domain-containing protein [Phellopilus nigrolimitatus]